MEKEDVIKRLVSDGEFFGVGNGITHLEHIAAHRYLSNSGMTSLLKSAAHYQAYLRSDRTPSKAQNLGTGTHLAILEGALHQVAAQPDADGRTKEGKEIKARFAADNIGKVIVTQDEYSQIVGMANAVGAHPLAADLFSKGRAETSFFWRDPETGTRLKGRADYLRPDYQEIIDLKTTEDASGAFNRSALNYGYFRQAALYCDGVDAVFGFRPTFKLVAVEKTDPFAVAVFTLTDSALDYGRKEYKRALQIYYEAEKTGNWSGYASDVQLLDLPPFAW